MSSTKEAVAPQIGLEPTPLRFTAERSAVALLKSDVSIPSQAPARTASDHLVEQLRTRVRDHHLVHQHPLLSDHLRSGVHGALDRRHYKSCYNCLGACATRADQLKPERESAGWTQQQAAGRLGVSQAYLALLENGRRRLTEQLALKLVALYGLSPAALPIGAGAGGPWDSSTVAGALSGLGYPGFRRSRRGSKRNPAVVILGALSADDLEVRVIEALPWLVARYYDLDWDWLIPEVKQRDLQNRLGFAVTLGRRLAERQGMQAAQSRLRQIEEILDRSRLVHEDTLCQSSLSKAERRWLRRSRPEDARHWNLLTDLDSEHLPYAA